MTKSPKVSYEEKIRKTKSICQKCGKELYSLGMGNHLANHSRQKMEENRPRYSEKQYQEAIAQVRKDTLEEAIGIVGKDEDWVNRPYVDKKNDYIAYAKNQLRQELRKKLLSLISSMKGGKE